MLATIKDAITPTQEPTITSASVDADTLAHIVSNQRRRITIRHLYATGATPLRELAEHVADIEDADYKPVYVTLYQSHIDQLEQAGIAAADGRNHVVTPLENIDAAVRAADEIEQLAGGDA